MWLESYIVTTNHLDIILHRIQIRYIYVAMQVYVDVGAMRVVLPTRTNIASIPIQIQQFQVYSKIVSHIK